MGTEGTLGGTREYTRARTHTSSHTHTNARTDVCVCACGPREGEFASVLVSACLRIGACAYARGAVPACVRGCAAASMRMRGVLARLRARLCAFACARRSVCARACARARLRMRAFVCACARVLPVHRQSIFAHACGRECGRAHMCGTPVRVCLGGRAGAAVARRRPVVLIARPAAPGGGARCGCGSARPA